MLLNVVVCVFLTAHTFLNFPNAATNEPVWKTGGDNHGKNTRDTYLTRCFQGIKIITISILKDLTINN